jgi:signal transduction histidine kinase
MTAKMTKTTEPRNEIPDGRPLAGRVEDIREPLSVISNAAYYLKRHVGGDGGKVDEYLGLIDDQVRRACELIDDLDKAERGSGNRLTK